MLIVPFCLAIVFLPPNGFAGHDVSIRGNGSNYVQLIGHNAVASRARCQQRIIHNGILIIRNAMPNEAATFSHGTALHQGIVPQSKVEVIPSIALVFIRCSHEH